MDPDAQGAETLGQPMQGGFLRPLPPTASKDDQTSVLNDIISRLNDLLQAQIIADDTTKRYIQGYSPGRWPDGDFGIAISAESQDVLTAEFENLIFAWDFTTNKQYIRGGTQYYYDPRTGVNHTQIGTLPDGTGGVAVAAEGEEVADAYS